MLAKIQIGSIARACCVILACLALAACENEVSSDLYDLASGGQDQSDDLSSSGGTGDTSDDSAPPSLGSIIVAEGEHIIGAEVEITFIAAGAESGLSLQSGSTFNTQELASLPL